jgi:hypothetical protein
MKPWMRCLKGLNSAAIARVETTTASCEFSPVSARKVPWSSTSLPKYTNPRVAVSAPYTRVQFMRTSML